MYLLGTDEYIQYVVEKYSRMLLRTAYTIVHTTADAEDIVQEVFLTLITKRPQFRDAEHEKAWLIRAVINRSRNLIKSKAWHNISLDEHIPEAVDDDRGELLSAVLSLPEKYSIPVHLYYYEGYSIAEIAQIMKLPPATVGTRLSRARKMLKDMVEGDIEV
ncbi:MAG: sigma-70 family RNA polymerase sigma factor [Clostridia bacterium]|nr:sigma-70 family RNA polymerase sigma factor [Clostridia bacterium]